jgi:phage terminase small subunit
LTAPQPAYPTPWGLNAAGRKLWTASTSDEFSWAQHDLAVLEEACRTRDRIVQLDAAVASDGLMITSSQGSRLHPAVVEARQQRHTLAQLLKTLDIPELPEDVLPPARSVRGIRPARGAR